MKNLFAIILAFMTFFAAHTANAQQRQQQRQQQSQQQQRSQQQQQQRSQQQRQSQSNQSQQRRPSTQSRPALPPPPPPAPRIEFGVKAGINLPTLRMSESVQEALGDSKMGIGFNLGVTVDVPITRELYLQSGLELTMKGGKTTRKESSGFNLFGVPIPANLDLEMSTNPLFLQLPLYLAYKIEIDKSTRFVPRFGPYIAYGLSGKLSTKADLSVLGASLGGKLPEVDLFGESAFMKNFDYGLGFGLGLEYAQLGVSVGYELGLANLASDDFKSLMTLTGTDYSLKTSNLYLSLSYRF